MRQLLGLRLGVNLNDGTVYNAGILADSDDDVTVPMPMAPRKYNDDAKRGFISRKRQR